MWSPTYNNALYNATDHAINGESEVTSCVGRVSAQQLR